MRNNNNQYNCTEIIEKYHFIKKGSHQKTVFNEQYHQLQGEKRYATIIRSNIFIGHRISTAAKI